MRTRAISSMWSSCRRGKFTLHPPYMVVNYLWWIFMCYCQYELLVPSMNMLVDPAQPRLLVFHASCRPAQQVMLHRLYIVYSNIYSYCLFFFVSPPPFCGCPTLILPTHGQ